MHWQMPYMGGLWSRKLAVFQCAHKLTWLNGKAARGALLQGLPAAPSAESSNSLESSKANGANTRGKRKHRSHGLLFWWQLAAALSARRRLKARPVRGVAHFLTLSLRFRAGVLPLLVPARSWLNVVRYLHTRSWVMVEWFKPPPRRIWAGIQLQIGTPR